jgi:hypothetical protein
MYTTDSIKCHNFFNSVSISDHIALIGRLANKLQENGDKVFIG